MSLVHTYLEAHFHRPDRARLDTEPAGDALGVQEINPFGYRVNNKSAHRAHGNAGSAMGAPGLQSGYILDQRLYFYSCIGYEANGFIVVLLLAAQLQHQDALFIGGYRSLQDIELKVIVFDQTIYYGLVDEPRGKTQHYLSRYNHGKAPCVHCTLLIGCSSSPLSFIPDSTPGRSATGCVRVNCPFFIQSLR